MAALAPEEEPVDRMIPTDDDADLDQVLRSLGGLLARLTWSISDVEWWLRPGVPAAAEALVQRAGQGYAWLSGEELLALARWVTVANWGAVLGFADPPSDLWPIPRSEGRPEGAGIQHPAALVELQCVDGGGYELWVRGDLDLAPPCS